MKRTYHVVFGAGIGLILLSLGVVLCTGLDRDSFWECTFWEGAEVAQSDSGYGFCGINVIRGDRTVLMIHNGYNRSRTSTGHASHDKLFMLLPGTIHQGDSYSCDSNDGTLYYSGYHGHGHSSLEPGTRRPARAGVKIIGRSEGKIIARIDASFFVINGRPEHVSCRWQDSRKGKFRFTPGTWTD